MTLRQPVRAGHDHDTIAVQPVQFSHPVADEPVDYQRLATASGAGTPSAFRTPFVEQPLVPRQRRARNAERVHRR